MYNPDKRVRAYNSNKHIMQSLQSTQGKIVKLYDKTLQRFLAFENKLAFSLK